MEKNPDKKLEGDVLPKTTASAPVSADPNWGLGGSYSRNPHTGKRELIGRTEDCINCRSGAKK